MEIIWQWSAILRPGDGGVELETLFIDVTDHASAGGGGKGSVNVYQLHVFADFTKITDTFESTQGLELQQNLAKYLELMKEGDDPFEITQAIIGNIEKLLPDEKELVTDFLLSKGETEFTK